MSRARRKTKSTVAELSITGEGVGLADDGGDAAGCRRLACGSKGFAVAGAWLADKGARRSESGCDDLAAIDDVGTFGHAGGADAAPGLSDDAVGDQNVADAVEIARRIDQPRWRAGLDGGRLTSGVRQVAGERLEHRHPHRHSHFHLFADQRLRAVGHDRVDFDAGRFIGPGCITSASGSVTSFFWRRSEMWE